VPRLAMPKRLLSSSSRVNTGLLTSILWLIAPYRKRWVVRRKFLYTPRLADFLGIATAPDSFNVTMPVWEIPPVKFSLSMTAGSGLLSICCRGSLLKKGSPEVGQPLRPMRVG